MTTKPCPAAEDARLRRLGVVCFCLWLVVLSCRKPAQVSPVHFAREEVSLDVRPGVLEVRGMYHFTCPAKEPLLASMFYPFPLDSNHLYPDSVDIQVPPGKQGTVPRRKPGDSPWESHRALRRDSPRLSGQSPFSRSGPAQDSGVSFRMRFRPGQEDSFFAYYRQPLRTNSATYIVTTTRKWKRPIGLAQFRVTVPATFQDVKLTYKPDSVVKADSTVSYYFTRRRFYPDRDVTVTWR